MRIVFFNENQKFKDKILTKLIDLGCESEAFNVNFYAINIPIQVDIEEIYIFLDEFVETDDLDYDTGYLGTIICASYNLRNIAICRKF